MKKGITAHCHAWDLVQRQKYFCGTFPAGRIYRVFVCTECDAVKEFWSNE